ncbi:MAG: acetylxylan esterase, partial [Armatimonadetes bacterium]|nr:acetylxylan esterase [Armatimonadota bacterium]
MPSIDWPIDRLVTYQPPLTRTPDFDSFWAETLAAARTRDLDAVLEPVDYPIRDVRVHRLTFAGFGGRRVHGWYLQPRDIESRKAPVVVQYHGYSGGAGQAHLYLPWVMLGCAVVTVDTRGQGGGTGDEDGYPGGSIPGWMTQGILDPAGYYYRKSYTDCVRAIDFVFSRPELDTRHVCVTGGSQGGGLTLAVAGLEPRVTIAMPDVPYLCHYQRAV